MSDFLYCQHCDGLMMLDDACEIPVPSTKANPATEIILYVCDNCFDEVCDEEGINPQTLEPLT